MNKIDILSGFGCIKIALSYSHPKLGTITNFPADSKILSECKANYMTLEGWTEDISQIKEYSQLPPATKKFVTTIEEQCLVPICVLGTGPQKEQYIVKEKKAPFTSLL